MLISTTKSEESDVLATEFSIFLLDFLDLITAADGGIEEIIEAAVRVVRSAVADLSNCSSSGAILAVANASTDKMVIFCIFD